MEKKKNVFIVCVLAAVLLAAAALALLWLKPWCNEPEVFVFEQDYAGEHMVINEKNLLDYSAKDTEDFALRDVLSFSEYASYCEKYELRQKYTDESKNYIVYSNVIEGCPIVEARLADVVYDGSEATLYVWSNFEGVTGDCLAYCVIVPTEQEVTTVRRRRAYLPEDLEPKEDDLDPEPEKPIIYLYPTEETEVSVKLGYEDLITTSYPKYEGEWKVLARPDGSLTDLDTGRNLYALYYESISPIDYQMEKDGFVVRGENTVAFLEEKLAVLGLTDREAEEFIVYWLPKLESNPYNYIRFATPEEIDGTMPLHIQPVPDSTIRVLMAYQGLEQPIPVEEQKLETPKRDGFTAVEWGGFEIP